MMCHFQSRGLGGSVITYLSPYSKITVFGSSFILFSGKEEIPNHWHCLNGWNILKTGTHDLDWINRIHISDYIATNKESGLQNLIFFAISTISHNSCLFLDYIMGSTTFQSLLGLILCHKTYDYSEVYSTRYHLPCKRQFSSFNFNPQGNL